MRVSVGVDVAKDIHWVCAVDQDARILLDHAVSNTQADLNAFVADLKRLTGEVTVGLDVMGSIATSLQAALLAEGAALGDALAAANAAAALSVTRRGPATAPRRDETEQWGLT